MRWLTLGYYRILRRICRHRPELRRLRKRCVRCSIYFLTSPSNRRRLDLACPFGCRKECARKKANKRGRHHYKTSKGRASKAKRNRRRSLITTNSGGHRDAVIGRHESRKPTASHLSRDVLQYIGHLLLKLIGQQPPRHNIVFWAEELLEWMDVLILRQRSLKVPDE